VSNTKDWEEYDATMSLEDRLTLAAIRRRLEEVGMIPSPSEYQPPIDMHTELWPGRGEAGGYGGKRSRKNKTAV
jgi:hypothetical protein